MRGKALHEPEAIEMRNIQAETQLKEGLSAPQGAKLSIYTKQGAVTVALSPVMAEACCMACGFAAAPDSAPKSRLEGDNVASCKAYRDDIVAKVVIPYLEAARRVADKLAKI